MHILIADDSAVLILFAFESMDKDMIEEYAQFIADKLNDPKLSKGIKWMWVGNFVESVLR